jgi:putative nucleotidyltransferase with HDIG domain/PAS domain S-box-containing protein
MATAPHTQASTLQADEHDSADRAPILITDDRPEMLLAIDTALGARFECEFAGSVGEAREKLASKEFKLAVCDVNAAGETAMALAEEILREHRGTAVVLVTGEDDPQVADRAFALGVHGYLVEPLQPGQLLITVMNGLRWRDLEKVRAAHARNLLEQFQTIIDRAPIPIFAKDDDYRYVVANAKAEELAGFDGGGVIGKTDRDLMDSVGAAEAQRGDRVVLDGGAAFEVDEEMQIGGVERIFHTVKFPLLDECREIAAVGGLSIDITSQREAIRLRDELTASQQEAIEELRLSREETVERLVRALGRHDSSTGLHVIRIGRLAARLATALGLDPEQIELLRLAAPMHDIGKIATPDGILQKPGPLAVAERREMQRHAEIGHEILSESQSELLRMAAKIALTHHERYDGAGYPHGIAGAAIPIEGRVTAVADVFDALLSERCYRPALPLDEVRAFMAAGRGTQFDPEVVDALLADFDGCVAARD